MKTKLIKTTLPATGAIIALQRTINLNLRLLFTFAAAIAASFLLASCTAEEADAFGHGMDAGYHAAGGAGDIYHDSDGDGDGE